MKPMAMLQAFYPFKRIRYLKDNMSFKTTIRKKILGGFIIVIALVVLMSAFTYFKVDELNTSSQEMTKESLYHVGLVEELAIDVANEAVAMRGFIFTNSLADVAAFDEARKYGDDKIIKLDKVLSSEKARAFLETLKKEKGAYDAIATKTINAKRANNIDEVGVNMKQADQPYNNSMTTVKYLILAVKEDVKLEAEYNTQKASGVQTILVIVSLLVGALSVLISIYISRGISRSTMILAREAAEIADGYLGSDDIVVKSSDEIGQLGASFNKMKTNLRDLIKKVSVAAQQVAASSQHLTASADLSAQTANQVTCSVADVAQDADMQLVAINETAQIVQQMFHGIQQIAANANSVVLKSTQATETATAGGEAVFNAVNQMSRIKQTVNSSAQVVTKLGEHSNEIGKIVDTISGIASQTNLLALNAAIEAARAGDNGRGFAVVADEVRKLAEQSQTAAKQIAKLIGEIQGDTNKAVVAMKDGNNEVNVGTELVDAAGKAFQDIVILVIAVTSQVKEITTSIQGMSCSSQQIVSSVEKIDVLSRKASCVAQSVSVATQEQSATMEEIASSSQILAKMAYELQEAINLFRF